MAKNKIQFQKGLSLPRFLSQYGTEEQCREALFKMRGLQGFRCPKCGHLAEFCYRFNRRFQMHTMVDKLVYVAQPCGLNLSLSAF